MSTQSHHQAAEGHHHAAQAHEAALKSHKAAAELHQKGEHKLGLEHAEKAVKESETAHKSGGEALAHSKSAGH